MRHFLIIRIILFSAVFFIPFALLHAAELYINTDGKTQIKNAEITYLNNNVITVTLWGSRWVLYVKVDDSGVKLTNAAGEPITVWDLKKGDMIYVEGSTREVGVGKIEIDVGLLRDMSIAGSGSSIVQPVIAPLAPVLPESPLPAPAAVAVPAVPQAQEPVSAPVVPPSAAPIPVVAAPSLPVSASTPAPDGVFQRGMKGDRVREMQAILLAKGYLQGDEVTGYFGPATEAAIKKLQKENGLEQVGFVGPRTEKLIASLREAADDSVSAVQQETSIKENNGAAGSITQNLDLGMRGKEVAALQEFLQKNNFGIPNDGPVTGYYGSVTAKAVANFQKANGLAAVGIVGQETRALINNLFSGGGISEDAAKTAPEPSVKNAKAAIEQTVSSGVPAKKQITQTLRLGMRGQEVKILQEFLQKNNWGIPDDGPVTGYYGARTAKAVSDFQKANGLEAVGVVGAETRGLINGFLAGE